MNAPERVPVRLAKGLALDRDLELAPSPVNLQMLPQEESGSAVPNLVDKSPHLVQNGSS